MSSASIPGGAAADEAETNAEQNTAASAAAQSCASNAEKQDGVPTVRSALKRAQIQTVRLDSRDLNPSWPLAIASLEQLSGWAVLALRLGTLALIQQCVRELAQPDAPADLVVRLRVLTEALAHMPLEA
ncbi:MAG TPA: hypothetical protein VLE97_05790 [Gaiellaceae bacterium]|nr:hypothetical protein [Gaiellaceae bacterium]